MPTQLPRATEHRSPTHLTNPTVSPLRVLLVEDNLADARLVREYLEESPEFPGTIDHVTRLSEALAMAHEHRFDLALLDLGLPDASGLDAVRQFRTLHPSTAILVVTGTDDARLAYEAVRKGAHDVLFKRELSPLGLIRAVRKTLASWASSSPVSETLPRQQTPDLETVARVGPCARVVARLLETTFSRLDIEVHTTNRCLSPIRPADVRGIIRLMMLIVIDEVADHQPIDLKLRVWPEDDQICVQVRPSFVPGDPDGFGPSPRWAGGVDACRALAEAHGGTVFAWRGDRRGTILRLTLPAVV